METTRLENFDFEVYDSLTPEALGQLSKEHPISRSSHLGNQYPSNLAIISLGVRQMLFDRNTAVKDKNYHPSYVVKGHQARKIGDDSVDKVALFTPLTEPAGKVATVGEWHFRGLKDKFPDKEIDTFSAKIKRNEGVLEPVLQAVMEHAPQEFDRYVSSSGVILEKTGEDEDGVEFSDGQNTVKVARKDLVKSALDLSRILHASSHESKAPTEGGVLFSNLVNILVCSLIDVVDSDQLKAQEALVYHCSGPDMVKYMLARNKECVRRLDEIYRSVRASLKGTIPAIQMKLVPTADLRFAFKDQSSAKFVEEWYARFEALRSAEQEKRKIMPTLTDPDNKKAYIREFEGRKKGLLGDVKSAVAEAQSKIDHPLYDLSKASFFSQYDLEQGGQTYLPEFIRTATLNEISGVYLYNYKDIAQLIEKEKRKALTQNK